MHFHLPIWKTFPSTWNKIWNACHRHLCLFLWFVSFHQLCQINLFLSYWQKLKIPFLTAVLHLINWKLYTDYNLPEDFKHSSRSTLKTQMERNFSVTQNSLLWKHLPVLFLFFFLYFLFFVKYSLCCQTSTECLLLFGVSKCLVVYFFHAAFNFRSHFSCV